MVQEIQTHLGDAAPPGAASPKPRMLFCENYIAAEIAPIRGLHPLARIPDLTFRLGGGALFVHSVQEVLNRKLAAKNPLQSLIEVPNDIWSHGV